MGGRRASSWRDGSTCRRPASSGGCGGWRRRGSFAGIRHSSTAGAVGLDLLCFVEVKLAHHRPDCVARFRDEVQAIPEVLECHYLTGESDYLIKIVVPNHKALETVLFEGLMRIDGVDRIHTSIVVNEVKVSTVLPLEAPSRSPGRGP